MLESLFLHKGFDFQQAKDYLISLNINEHFAHFFLEYLQEKYQKRNLTAKKFIDYLNSYDNLFCIGRNGQHRYNNMDHSILTGFVAVDKILNKKIDKTDLWNVNTEKEYHESK